jgi:hypothetical protein
MIHNSPEIPFDIVSDLSLRPRKAVNSEFSTRAGLAANAFAFPGTIPLILMLPARQIANSLIEHPRSEIYE